MAGHAMYGTNDMARSREFYDPIMAKLGAAPNPWTSSVRVFYALPTGELQFVIGTPLNGERATVGNGTMIAFIAASRRDVDDIHRMALELGGSDEGRPGIRGDDPDGFYAAYFRDPEGHKLSVYRFGPA